MSAVSSAPLQSFVNVQPVEPAKVTFAVRGTRRSPHARAPMQKLPSLAEIMDEADKPIELKLNSSPLPSPAPSLHERGESPLVTSDSHFRHRDWIPIEPYGGFDVREDL